MNTLTASPYSLTLGTLIRAKIRANNLYGEGTYSAINTAGALIETIPSQVSPAPTKGSNTNNTSIEVDWIALTSSGTGSSTTSLAITYSIYGRLISTPPYVTLSTSLSSPTYETQVGDGLSITEGQEYEYYVIASNKYGSSIASAVVTIKASTTPAQMNTVTTQNSNIYIIIDFDVPLARGDPVIDYEILILQHSSNGGLYISETEYCDGTDSTVISTTRCIIPMSTLRASPFSLTLGTILNVKVRARNVIGYGDYSNPNTIGAVIQTEPGQMASPTKGYDTNHLQLHVIWAESAKTGGSPITSYHLQYKLNVDSAWIDAQGLSPLSTDREATIDDNIQTGELYDFQVRARNVYDWGAFSATTSFKAAKVPADITNAIVTSYSGTKVRFVWEIPHNGGLPITSYLVEFVHGNNSFVTSSECVPQELTSTTEYCEVKMLTFFDTFSLPVNTTIQAQVKAENELDYANNYSPLNTIGATVKRKPLVPLNAPEEGANTSEAQVEVVIDALTGDYTGESPVLTYEIYWDNGSGQDYWIRLVTIVENSSPEYSYTYSTGINSGDVYYYKYRANNLYGKGEFSSPAAIKASTVPAQMEQPILTEVGLGVVITWEAPSARGDVITQYNITFYDYNSNQYVENTSLCDGAAELNTLTCTVPMIDFEYTLGYSKGQLLLVKAQAINAQGSSVPSEELTSGLVYKAEPEQVTGLSAVSTSADTIILTWDNMNSAPLNGYSAITNYEVWYDNAGAETDLIFYQNAGTAATYTASSLQVGLTYQWAVLATNKFNSSILSNELTFLTAFVPSTMNSITTSEVNTGITLTWVAPSDIRGSAVTAYRIMLLNKSSNTYSEYPSL